MLAYLDYFSSSFKIMFAIWPFVVAVATVPLLMYEYIKFHRLPLLRVVLNYCFMLYAVGLFFAFTLYPFPDDFDSFCAIERQSTQLIPLTAISSVLHSGVPALMQIGLNFIFFIPLGLFLRNFWGRKLSICLPIMFLTSLTIEILQLTHPYLPCQYRLFDVDDLVINTAGGILGYGIGKFLPDFSRTSKIYVTTPNNNPKIVQRLVTWLTEWLLTTVVASIVYLALYFLIFNQIHYNTVYTIIFTITLFLTQFILPIAYKGYTLIGLFTNTILDNKKRSNIRRVIYYSVRFTVLALICNGSIFYQPLPIILVLIISICYPFLKKPFYAVI